MSDERHYDDDEMRDIFDRATRLDDEDGVVAPHEPDAPSGRGMSLAELQQIGMEAGIDPAAVARAAAQLEVSSAVELPTVTQFGVPVSVGRTVDLPRRLTEGEWDALVVQIRDLFHARGTVSREGSLRSWSNGNLQILMEPTREGYRLRMRSLSSDLRGRLLGGAFMGVGVSLISAITLLVGASDFRSVLVGVSLMAGIGGVMFGSGVFGARRWISQRTEQFRLIGASAVELASDPGPEALPPGR
jgi:hypothetical protein